MRSRSVAAVSAGLVAMTMTACAGPPPSAGAPLPSTPATVESGPLRTPPSGETPTPVPSLRQEQTAGLESTPWQPVAIDGRDITIRYVAGGGCSAFAGVRVLQTVEHVEVWTTVRTDRTAHACAAYLLTGATTIRLDAPLGTRPLLHAPVSGQWKALIRNF